MGWNYFLFGTSNIAISYFVQSVIDGSKFELEISMHTVCSIQYAQNFEATVNVGMSS